jgi:hypothetical protein
MTPKSNSSASARSRTRRRAPCGPGPQPEMASETANRAASSSQLGAGRSRPERCRPVWLVPPQLSWRRRPLTSGDALPRRAICIGSEGSTGDPYDGAPLEPAREELIVRVAVREHVLGRRGDLSRLQSVDPKQVVRPQNPTGCPIPGPEAGKLLRAIVQGFPARVRLEADPIFGPISDLRDQPRRVVARAGQIEFDDELSSVGPNRDELADRPSGRTAEAPPTPPALASTSVERSSHPRGVSVPRAAAAIGRTADIAAPTGCRYS